MLEDYIFHVFYLFLFIIEDVFLFKQAKCHCLNFDSVLLADNQNQLWPYDTQVIVYA